MTYDEAFADRIRKTLSGRRGVTEKKMFGGIAFLLDGKMFCGIAKEKLMVRVGEQRHESALSEAHVRPMDFTGRPMKGYVFVEPAGLRTSAQVGKWVKRGVEFVATVEKKAQTKRRPRRKK